MGFLYVPRPQGVFLSCLQEKRKEQILPSSAWHFTGIYAKSQAAGDVPEHFQLSLWDLGRHCHLLLCCLGGTVFSGWGLSWWCSLGWAWSTPVFCELAAWEARVTLTHVQRKLNNTMSMAWLWDRRWWIPVSLVSALIQATTAYGVSHLSLLP